MNIGPTDVAETVQSITEAPRGSQVYKD